MSTPAARPYRWPDARGAARPRSGPSSRGAPHREQSEQPANRPPQHRARRPPHAPGPRAAESCALEDRPRTRALTPRRRGPAGRHRRPAAQGGPGRPGRGRGPGADRAGQGHPGRAAAAAARPRPPGSWRRWPSRPGSRSWSWPPTSSTRRPRTACQRAPPATSSHRPAPVRRRRRDGRSAAVRLRTAESGVLAAADTQAVAESLLEHALAPLGATAVAMWAAGADASLTLAGYAGFSPAEASAVALRAAGRGHPGPARPGRAAQGLVHLPVRPGLPSIGQHQLSGGGRVAVPAGTGGRILGVLEIGWPDPLPPQPPQIDKPGGRAGRAVRAHAGDDAPPSGAAPHRASDMAELMDLVDALPDPALVLCPHLDAEGRLTDFRIHHANSRFADPAGRPRGSVTGALLLEAYPLAAGDSGLLEKIEHVYATGEPFRAEGMTLTALVDQVPLIGRRGHQPQPARQLRPADLAGAGRDGAAGEPAPARPAAGPHRRVRGEPADRRDHLERPALRPVRPDRRRHRRCRWRNCRATPIPTTPSPSAASCARCCTTGARRHRLPAAAAGRHDPAHPGRGRTRPGRRRAPGRRPRGLPGHLRPALDRGGAGRDPRPAGPHRAAGQRAQPADPAVAARHHAAGAGPAEGARPPRRRPLPAGGDRAAGRRRLVRRRRCCRPGRCCCASATWPGTASRRPPAWSCCATRCAGWRPPAPVRPSC